MQNKVFSGLACYKKPDINALCYRTQIQMLRIGAKKKTNTRSQNMDTVHIIYNQKETET